MKVLNISMADNMVCALLGSVEDNAYEILIPNSGSPFWGDL